MVETSIGAVDGAREARRVAQAAVHLGISRRELFARAYRDRFGRSPASLRPELALLGHLLGSPAPDWVRDLAHRSLPPGWNPRSPADGRSGMLFAFMPDPDRFGVFDCLLFILFVGLALGLAGC